MSKGKLTRRERLSELLKKEILDAAAQVFTEYGYERATTKKIAAKADVSEGTLYYYFKNKRDILMSLFRILIDNITQNLNLLSSPDDKSDVKAMFADIMKRQLSFNSSLPILTLFLHEARIDPVLQKTFSDLIQSVRSTASERFKHLVNKEIIGNIDHHALGMLMSLIAIGYTTLLEAGDEALIRKPVNKLASEISGIIVDGVRPAKS